MSDKLKIPFILEPSNVTNYFQVVAKLKAIQQKNKKYSVLPVKTSLFNLLKPVRREYDIQTVLDVFVYEKIREKVKEYEKANDKEFIQNIKAHLKEIKRQNENNEKCTRNNMDVTQFEQNFYSLPTEELFNNSMLFDLYTFLNTVKPSIDFDQEVIYLGIEYIKYIDRFLTENSSEIIAPLKTFEDKVSVFVKMKFSYEDYNLEVYEGRYLFAEIYIYLRCGLSNSILNLLNQYSSFFNSLDNDFKRNLTSWLNSKAFLGMPINLSQNEDRFKKVLYEIMQGKTNIVDNYIVTSVEDFLWIQLINVKNDSDVKIFQKKFENYKSKRGLLIVLVMTKQYEKAMDFLYFSDLPILPTYYLMYELAKRSEDKKLFVDLTFIISTKMNNVQKKLDCITNLDQVVDDFEECASSNIVKYKLFDILGLSLSKNIDYCVVKRLKDINDRKHLLKVYKLIDDSSLLTEILIDIFTEGIITGQNIEEPKKIFLEIKKTDESINVKKLDILLKFNEFVQSPDIATLKKTSFFSIDFKLIDVKFVLEKVFKVACEVIKKANDYEMAKDLFRAVGEMELSVECTKFINKELVVFL